jgi:hypothetical protein
MTPAIFEILEEVSKAKTRDEKVSILKSKENPALVTVLRAALDKSVVFALPKTAPPFKENELPAQEARLYSEVRRFKYLTTNTQIPAMKRETIFIEMLEAVHPKDAQVLVSMISKKLPYKGITSKMVNIAFPGLIRQE